MLHSDEVLLVCAQRGIDLGSLDVTYFTSLSYYFLLLFGLRGVFSLVFRCVTVVLVAEIRLSQIGYA